MSHSIIISADFNDKVWAVVCLAYEYDCGGKYPSYLVIDDVCNVLVGWAKDKIKDHPIYLHVTGMSRSKQKFMLNTGFYALKEKGYQIKGV